MKEENSLSILEIVISSTVTELELLFAYQFFPANMENYCFKVVYLFIDM